MGHFEFCRSSQLLAAAHTSFQLLDKQPNFVFGLARACADKIQLRFQKRSLAAAGAKEALGMHPRYDKEQNDYYWLVLFVLTQKEPKKSRAKPKALRA
jgi:hypothetical protein